MRSMCWARPARKDVALILEGEFSEYGSLLKTCCGGGGGHENNWDS